MAEELKIAEGGKEERYALLYEQIKSLLAGETDPIARMANVAAMIHFTFRFFWTGFYRVVGEELVLGPFQGPLACMRIGYGRGVCGAAWKEGHTLVVPDVEQFPGHIACDSASNSEIVVPIFKDGTVWGVLDIDSPTVGRFTEQDQTAMEALVKILEKTI